MIEIYLPKLDIKFEEPKGHKIHNIGRVKSIARYVFDLSKEYPGQESESSVNKKRNGTIKIYKKKISDQQIYVVYEAETDLQADYQGGHEETRLLLKLGKISLLEEKIGNSFTLKQKLEEMDPVEVANIGGIYAVFRKKKNYEKAMKLEKEYKKFYECLKI